MLNHFLTVTIPHLLRDFSLLTFLAIYGAGILTSVSPCVLSVLPVLVGFIGGYSQPSRLKGFSLSLFFVLGLSTTFALLGVAAVTMGSIFGQVGDGWYYGVAIVSLLMGLHLLEIFHFRFPTLTMAPPKIGGYFGAFVIGLFFGVVASPCATPVLVAILAVVSGTGRIFSGAALLFVYGLGHGLPLLIAGTFTGMVKQVPRFRVWTRYINYFSGVLLLLVGLYFLYLVRASS